MGHVSTDTSRDEMNTINMPSNDSSSGGAASPLTARSLRLERFAQVLADSQEELRRFVFHFNFILSFYYLMYLLPLD